MTSLEADAAPSISPGRPELQLEHHTGYPPTDRDRADVARLCEQFTIPLPEGYK